MLLFARTRQPIPFGALDGQPVSILLAIVVPEHANDDHAEWTTYTGSNAVLKQSAVRSHATLSVMSNHGQDA